MDTLTKKYIFKQKLAGESIRVDEHNIDWDLLEDCGIWELRQTAFRGLAYVIMYPLQMRKGEANNVTFQTMEPGDLYRV